jgi:hypothetical protein
MYSNLDVACYCRPKSNLSISGPALVCGSVVLWKCSVCYLSYRLVWLKLVCWRIVSELGCLRLCATHNLQRRQKLWHRNPYTMGALQLNTYGCLSCCELRRGNQPNRGLNLSGVPRVQSCVWWLATKHHLH